MKHEIKRLPVMALLHRVFRRGPKDVGVLVRDERCYDAQERHPGDDEVDDERKGHAALPEVQGEQEGSRDRTSRSNERGKQGGNKPRADLPTKPLPPPLT